GKLVKLVDETLEKSWITWSEEMIEMIQNMSLQDRKDWFQGEGSKPMKTIGIKEDLISFIDEDIHNHLEIFTDQSELEQRSKTRLAILWGMSNAICKKKSS
ncbi:hypothetical protein DC859_28200, partial [Vibrio parahaemolyticus]|nr:hypothetical protein [Vibrio parahaemolyticus]